MFGSSSTTSTLGIRSLSVIVCAAHSVSYSKVRVIQTTLSGHRGPDLHRPLTRTLRARVRQPVLNNAQCGAVATFAVKASFVVVTLASLPVEGGTPGDDMAAWVAGQAPAVRGDRYGYLRRRDRQRRADLHAAPGRPQPARPRGRLRPRDMHGDPSPVGQRKGNGNPAFHAPRGEAAGHHIPRALDRLPRSLDDIPRALDDGGYRHLLRRAALG